MGAARETSETDHPDPSSAAGHSTGSPRRWRAPSDEVAAALAAVGLDPSQFRIDRHDASYFGGGLHAQQLLESFTSDPLGIEANVKVFRRTLCDGAANAADLVLFGTVRLREGVRRGLIGSPLFESRRAASGPLPLAAAIARLDARGGRRLSTSERRDLDRAASRVPPSVARPAALLVESIGGVLDWRERALRSVSPAERASLFRSLVDSAARIDYDDEAFAPLAEALGGRIEFKALNAGATDLALALDAAVQGLPESAPGPSGPGSGAEPPLPPVPGLKALLSPREPMALSFRAATPYGDIVITGDGDDRHDGRSLLVIDTGGKDSYFGAGATSDASSGISLVIDLGGDDVYGPARGPRTTPSSGAGVLGYGYLVDLGGDDRYRGSLLSQGTGLFGVGLLIDGAGQDRYSGGVATQGAGLYGVGILSDVAGDDVYECGQMGQGLGYVRGLGVLVDAAGNDRYTADDTTIRYPSPQTPQHNTSLAQGVGIGRRADYSDGLSLAGGVGLLVDGSGDDAYAAGVFAQGAGYWYGVGILDDAAGRDAYAGVWYVQGSAAHFGVGALIDEGGDDTYRATMNMAQGAGHDFSLGELIDESGDDRYEAPNLSLGGGNDNGIGFFWDRGGRDRYTVAAETTLGRANITSPRGGLRDRMLCLGLFLDTGGAPDVYSKSFARDGTLWTQQGLDRSSPLEAEKGVGLDR